MPCRGDFYCSTESGMEWLGSLAYDGHPGHHSIRRVLTCIGEKEYRSVVGNLLQRTDATRPEMGWPWVYATSAGSDYAYCFDGKAVLISYHGSGWFTPNEDQQALRKGEWGKFQETLKDRPVPSFPEMSTVRRVTSGVRSGVPVWRGGAFVDPHEIDAEEARMRGTM